MPTLKNIGPLFLPATKSMATPDKAMIVTPNGKLSYCMLERYVREIFKGKNGERWKYVIFLSFDIVESVRKSLTILYTSQCLVLFKLFKFTTA